jgi:uncharacterized phage protein (TIGR01671 family)
MKEIEFRAWDDGKKEWLLGYELKNLGGFSLFGECVLLGEWSQVLDQFVFERHGHKQDDLIVMQFTGLNDKNGKQIYEGDIVKVATRSEINGLLYSDLGSVIFSENVGSFGVEIPNGENGSVTWSMQHFVLNEFEVVGNIYENPELLKA